MKYFFILVYIFFFSSVNGLDLNTPVKNVDYAYNLLKTINEESYVKFFLYNRKHPNGFLFIPNNDENLKESGYDSFYPTKVLIHGLNNYYKSDAVQLPKNAYLEKGNYNIIIVDWQKHSILYWFHAQKAVKTVGHETGFLLKYLMNKRGLKLSNLHIIGHSLGAHVAGFVAKGIGSKPGRVTGLDPAGPLFTFFPPSERLNTEAAHFVDIIHTNIIFFGIKENIGHADFYPAGDVCDHGKSFEYFAQSINNKNKFQAVKCKTLSDALNKNCKGKKTAQMGEYAIEKKPQGIYYVDPNSL